jgi:hypothetical protein
LLEHTIGLLTGDFNGDGDVGETDQVSFAGCFSGQDQPFADGCEQGDFDGDADIDCSDWLAFGNAWTKRGAPAVLPQCAGTIPATSAWGLLVLCLSTSIAGSIVFYRQNRRRGAAV